MAWFNPTPPEISCIEQLEAEHIRRLNLPTNMDNCDAVLKAEEYLHELSQGGSNSHFLNQNVRPDYFEETWKQLEIAHGSKVLTLVSPEGFPLNRPNNLPPTFQGKER